MICGRLPLVLGLEVLGRGYSMNQGWMLLVSGLGPFCGHHNVSLGKLPLVPCLWPLH